MYTDPEYIQLEKKMMELPNFHEKTTSLDQNFWIYQYTFPEKEAGKNMIFEIMVPLTEANNLEFRLVERWISLGGSLKKKVTVFTTKTSDKNPFYDLLTKIEAFLNKKYRLFRITNEK